MKTIHRLLAFLFSLVLVLTMLPTISLEVRAAPYRDPRVTRDEAVGWAEYHASQRTSFDVDGIYGVQCSDLGSAYINWILTGNPINSPYNTVNGYQYFNLDYPEGWIKIRNTLEFVPEPGDILVWGEGYCPYGHVAIALSGCDTNRMRCVEQVGADYHIPTRVNTISYKGFIGAVRPLWKSANVNPSKPNARATKAVYANNEQVTVQWDKCSDTQWYDVEVYDDKTNQIVYSLNSTNTNADTTSFTTGLREGLFKAKVYAVNQYGGEYHKTVSDDVYFRVAPKPEDLGQSFDALILMTAPWKPVVVAGTHSGANVEIGTEKNLAKEHWHFDRNSDGTYTITSYYGGKVLDVSGANTADGTNIQCYDKWGEDNGAQKWYLFKFNGKGTYRFVTKLSLEKCMDSYGADSYDGNNIHLWGWNDSPAQEFSIYSAIGVIPTAVEASDMVIEENKTAAIDCKFTPENTDENRKTMTWTSADPNVATVDENGVVTGKAIGSTTIEGVLRYNDTLRVKINVTVKKKPSFDLYGSSMVLGNNLNLECYVPVDKLKGNTDVYAQITKHYADNRKDVVIKVPFNDWKNSSDQNLKFVEFSGISAKEMMDTVSVQIFDKNDEALSTVYEDSIHDYAVRMLKKTSDIRLKSVLVDMLNYGAACQSFFKYDVSNLANQDISGYQQYATKNITFQNNLIKGTNYAGTSLITKSNIQMIMYFNNITPDMHAVISYTNHRGKKMEYTVSGQQFNYYQNLYGVVVDKLAVADVKQLVSCKIYDNKNVLVASASDSLESYVSRMSKGDPVFENIMKFGVSAYGYFHK